ncbi:hypothetical protein BDZ97DRAFT_1294752 [Flammula alnicola]|nr:hypothetical protein BDZ97DRAFT_1294752 [Flammula alnicola]
MTLAPNWHLLAAAPRLRHGLHAQGILPTPTTDEAEAGRTQLQCDLWLAEQRVNLAQRGMKKCEGNGQNKDQATREYENRVQEQRETRDRWDTFKAAPECDGVGRVWAADDAQGGVEGIVAQISQEREREDESGEEAGEEKKREAMASGDTPLGMNKAFKRLQENAGQTHFVLSVGNRSTVLPAPEHLDPQPLTKGKSEKRLKKEEDKSSAAASRSSWLHGSSACNANSLRHYNPPRMEDHLHHNQASHRYQHPLSKVARLRRMTHLY